ncbi:MAG: endonuclease/exonuclease/phosphatase family protein [Phycisphaerales bacterium]|nr:MAG: endonuclease/exonuclease/phosphatase family protein [Phycisphaerales bacterium]
MSFNLRYGTANDGENRWDNRRELLVETIRAFEPDLLGTQECLDFQADYLRARMPGYEFVGAGRNDGRESGEMAAILFKADRFEKLDEGHFWLSETPEIPGSKSWDTSLTRIASWVKLRSRRDPQLIIYFFNTHFDHRGEVARLESARLLRRKIQAIAGGLPAVITGDFNAAAGPPPSPPYQALVGHAPAGEPALIDTYRHLHPRPGEEEGTFNGFAGTADGPRIDWILTSTHFTTREAAIDRTNRDDRYPSDHFAVTAVLRCRPAR